MEQLDENKEILTIVVNYNSDDEVVRFVHGIAKQEVLSWQRILIVDNSGHLDIQNELDIESSSVATFVYTPPKNIGYFGGAAWGLQEYLKDYPMPEWIIVCNPDIEFQETRFFALLCERYPVEPPAVIAPDILLQSSNCIQSSRIHQNPHMLKRPSRELLCLRLFIYSCYQIYAIYEKVSGICHYVCNRVSRPRKMDDGAGKEIYAPFGAFIIFHRSFFELGGNLDHGGFLFGEEVFVAEQVRALGLKAVYDNTLKLIHKEHSSVGREKRRDCCKHLKESTQFILRKYFFKE